VNRRGKAAFGAASGQKELMIVAGAKRLLDGLGMSGLAS
jgi:hypothetical protein